MLDRKKKNQQKSFFSLFMFDISNDAASSARAALKAACGAFGCLLWSTQTLTEDDQKQDERLLREWLFNSCFSPQLSNVFF